MFSAGKTRNGFCKDPELNLRLPAGILSIILVFMINMIMMEFDQVYDDIHDHDQDDIYHDGGFHPGWQSDHRSAT